LETGNVELVRKLLEAVNRRDADAMIALVADDYEFVPIMAALEGRVYRGADGIHDWIADMDVYWEYFECCPLEYHDLGDRVIAFGTWHARGRASGVEVEGQPATWLAWLDDGVLQRWRTFTDRGEALAVAGVTEKELIAR
jgi:ketosteroid isomerase-like protein